MSYYYGGGSYGPSRAVAGGDLNWDLGLERLTSGTGTIGTESTTTAITIGNGSISITLDGADIRPATNDEMSIGVSGAAFSDLFLASGAVINFAASNYTITHATGGLTLTSAVSSSGVPTLLTLTGAAHTGVTADTEIIDVNINLARTVTLADGTTIATQRAVVIQAPTYAAAGATVLTEAATLAITGAPAAGALVTITGTNAYSLWCQAGIARLDGGLYVGTNGNVNDSVTPTDSMVQIVSDNTDAVLIFFDSGNAGWAMGLDSSDARAFVIGGDTTLGTSLAFRAAATTVGLYTAGTERLRIDNTSTATQTSLLIYDVDSTTLQRVLAGGNGTGPAGVGRALYVANV